jgi:NAD(P)-dependent dehydrogenase (short-subunit alcohol dehydrogenase family)
MGGRLDGQVVLVTGGGRGVGRAIGEALAAAGARVGLAARSGEQLAEAVAAVEAAGGVAQGWVLDVTDLDAVTGVIADVEARLGPVTLLANNAGTAHLPGPLWEVDPGDWWRDLEVHVRGAFNCCRAVLPGMVERGRGRVVNIGSLIGARDEAYVSAYACAKAASFG